MFRMKYFDYSEFDQKGLVGSGEEFMCKEFLYHIDKLREECGFPLFISSGYRSPEYNNKISSTGFDGPHTTGKACDIVVARGRGHKLLEKAFSMGVFTGIGVQQKGEGRFIHLDTLTENEAKGPRPTIWSY